MKQKENIIILLIWLIIVVIGCFYHEMWRDETQVWCIVRDLNLSEIFQTARLEGHPMMWYLLVLPFSKLGFPVESMQIISVAFVFFSLVFLLYKSPFDTLQKVLISFSAGMVYFLPVIARNYALIPLFLFLLAHFYNQRKEKPYVFALLLILLSQTHILMFGFCAILFLLFAVEQIKSKKAIPAILILLANFLFIIFSFYDADNVNMAVQNYRQLDDNIWKFLDCFCYIFFSPVFKYSNYINYVLFYGFIAFAFYSLFKSDKKIFLIYFVSFFYVCYIFARVWFAGVVYQKVFVLTLILIFCIWVIKNVQKQFKIAFNLFLVLSVILAINYFCLEIKYPFSCAKQVAQYIKENVKDETIVFKGYASTISPISAYLPQKRFYSLDKHKYVSYFIFESDDATKNVDIPADAKYYITQTEFYLFKELGYNLIFSSDEEIAGPSLDEEVYRIYEKI